MCTCLYISVTQPLHISPVVYLKDPYWAVRYSYYSIFDTVSCSGIFTTILFADDTDMFLKSKNVNKDIEQINKELNIMKSRCNINKLTLNTDETNYIIIKNPQNDFNFTK